MLASNLSGTAIVAAFDAVPQAVFVVDAFRAGRANAYVNGAYLALTGYAADEALASDFDALSIFAEPARVAALADTADLPAVMQLAIRRRDGTTCDTRLHLNAVPRETGGRYFVGLLETAPPGGEHAPSAASAVEAMAGTKTFLSWLNHELRSPLNACSMWLDVLALAPQPDKLAKAVDAIKRNLARQTRLINDLNDAAKILGDGIELAIVPLDLGALLERGLNAWQSLASAKPLEFEHRIELGDARIGGDPDRLAQAIDHVLESSLASTPSGGRVELRAREAGGDCVVEVDDGGSAISEQDAANLGTPLWRAPSSAKSRSGLGLGLAVAHHIVTQHGGSLTASSGNARTRFVLTLPLATDGRRSLILRGGPRV